MRRIQSSQRTTSAVHRGTPFTLIALLLILATALTACGDDGRSGQVEEDRRYATDPEPAPTDPPATETPNPTSTIVAQERGAPGASPASVSMVAASSVSNVFALVDGDVLVVDVQTGTSRVLARSTPEAEVALIVPSPDGSTVAVFRDRGGEHRVFDFSQIAPDGATDFAVSDLSALLGAGSGKYRGELAADWDGEGRRLAVVFPDGGGIVINIGGTAEVLLTRAQAPAPVEVAWSPDGEAIAFTSRDLDDDSPYLAIGGLRVLPLDPVRIAGTGGQRPIHALTWQPDGEVLLAIQGSGTDPDAIGGDLIQIDRGTLSVSFALGGSRFGPGAKIVMAKPAPDGRSWAIVTVAPGPGGRLQAAVWQAVSALSETSRLELGENPPVAGVSWTTEGITVTLFERGEVRIANFGPDGKLVIPATPAASPEADQGTPMASPVTELASPEASPEATPAPGT